MVLAFTRNFKQQQQYISQPGLGVGVDVGIEGIKISGVGVRVGHFSTDSAALRVSHEFWRILDFNTSVRVIDMEMDFFFLSNSGMDKKNFLVGNFILQGRYKNLIFIISEIVPHEVASYLIKFCTFFLRNLHLEVCAKGQYLKRQPIVFIIMTHLIN